MEKSSCRILFVAAEPEIPDQVLTLLRAAAARGPFTLTLATDPEAAREAMRAQPPDVILFEFDATRESAAVSIESLARAAPAAPMVALVKTQAETSLAAVQKLGAADLLALDEATPAELVRTIRYAIGHNPAQDALQRNDLLFRAAFRSSVIGMCITRPEGDFLEVNAALCRLLGYSQTELNQRKLASILHPEDSQKLRQLSADALQEKISSFQIEVRLIPQSGREKWVQWNIALIRDVRHRPLHFLNIAQDITQRRQAERALRESEQKFRSLVERSSEAVGLLTPEGRFAYVSSNADQILGYPVEALQAVPLIDMVHSHHQPLVTEGLMRLLQKPDHVERLLFRFRHRDGGWRWMETVLTNLLHEPAIRGIVTNMRDVTERKHWEEALSSSEERYRDLVMNANDLILTLDAEGGIIEINRAVESITGYSRAAMLVTSFFDYVAPEYRLIARHMLRAEPVSNRNHYDLEIIGRNGERILLEIGVRHLRRPGHPPRIQGIARDVTERRRALQALERQGLIFENLSDVIVVTDGDRRIIECNMATERLLGYSRDELLGRTPALLYPPDEAEAIYARMESGIRETGRWQGEVRLVRKDGRFAICDVVLVQLCDDHGRTTAIAGVIHDMTGRVQTETDLRQSEERYRAVVEQSADGIFLFEVESHRILDSNDAFQRMLGYSGEELRNMTIDQIVESNAPPVQANIDRIVSDRRKTLGERSYLHKDGQAIEVEVSASLIASSGSMVICALVRDIRQRRNLETQLRQAQKMEAVGRLAGGVAHDFNNLLTVITGYTDLLQSSTPPADQRNRFIHEIRQSAERAAALTRQLLAFSRQQVLAPRVFDLNRTLLETGTMLRRLIGEDIELEIAPSPRPAALRADPRQIEQVLLNLAVNARDAMPNGGQLRLEVGTAELTAEFCQSAPGARPGSYVILTVSDNGTGMDAATRSHIFEPFFSTKGERGTGLGLSTVYGIVSQSGGFLQVRSELRRGTTFQIFLPLADETPDEPQLEPIRVARPHPPSETILLVEDQEDLRQLLVDVLLTAGYQVLSAAHGAEAVEVSSRHSAAIHLLVTDMVMPHMNGSMTARKVRQLHPETRVLYISGYSEYGDGLRDTWIEQDFLQKPFTPGEFLRRVRDVLGLTPAPPRTPLAVEVRTLSKATPPPAATSPDPDIPAPPGPDEFQ